MELCNLDFSRKERTGFNETVFCSGKSDAQLLEIFSKLYGANGEVLGTRASAKQAELILKKFPFAKYDEDGRVLILQGEEKKLIGNIAICTAGSSDFMVAREAELTANFFGSAVTKFYDIGVAGINRLLSKIEEIRKANVIIAIAGMEGALASVLGGLVSVPIIAVPTSVGYGANFEGLTALLSMINSCANGISVVNIDNGYGAAYNAVLINRLAEGIKR